jgi:hypothetical protein
MSAGADPRSRPSLSKLRPGMGLSMVANGLVACFSAQLLAEDPSTMMNIDGEGRKSGDFLKCAFRGGPRMHSKATMTAATTMMSGPQWPGSLQIRLQPLLSKHACPPCTHAYYMESPS